jgi:signal transduction histidine kinase
VLARPTDRDALAIEVVDEGPGIAPSERQRVFERFHRGPPSGGGADGGTGLGLAIARWAVGLHGGTIEVADPAGSGGQGCRIRVLLPGRTDTRLR